MHVFAGAASLTIKRQKNSIISPALGSPARTTGLISLAGVRRCYALTLSRGLGQSVGCHTLPVTPRGAGQEAKRKHRKGELAAIDLHGVSSRFDRVGQSCSRAAACRALGRPSQATRRVVSIV